MRIYVASSWRNQRQPNVVAALRAEGHEVYDFRNPSEGDNGFRWYKIDPAWKSWSPERFRSALDHPIAESSYGKDFAAMRWANACVLVMPCGRSAHLEAGWFVGAGKPTAILLSDGEPELMYKLVACVAPNLATVLAWAKAVTGTSAEDEALLYGLDGLDGG